MTDIEKDFIANNPEYINKTLLLATRDRNGLFVSPEKSAHVLISIDGEGRVSVVEFTTRKSELVGTSLTEAVGSYLDLRDPTADEMLKHLVTPEMEVERIFNNLRFKYLNAIFVSNVDNPGKYLSSAYNKAFQALAGLIVYQGNPVQRKDNDAFWQEAGFTVEAKEQNWEKDQNELRTILSLLKRVGNVHTARMYAELIAIKPGFHEIYLHDDFFEDDGDREFTTPRDQVFGLLRNRGDIPSLTLDRFPSEMNKKSYFGYAPCNVTEGPFVFRKHLSVSYFEEIRRISVREKLHTLHEKFHILDYYDHDVSSREKLAELLEKARLFCGFMT